MVSCLSFGLCSLLEKFQLSAYILVDVLLFIRIPIFFYHTRGIWMGC